MEALPEEVLLKIFSYFTWNELKHLSLVNRRWYRVTGTASLIDGTYLSLSKVKSNYEHRANKDSYIDPQVLINSQRQYGAASIQIFFTEDVLIKSTLLGNLLEACLNRWPVKALRIMGQYEHLVLFLQRYAHLVANLFELKVTLEQFDDSNLYNASKYDNKECFLELLRLRNLSWIEKSLPSRSCPMPHSFTFTVPQLQSLHVHRKKPHGDNLMLYDCTALRTAHLNCYSLLESSLFDSDCSNLKQLTIDGYRVDDHKLATSSRLLRKLTSLELYKPKNEDLRVVNRFAKELKILKLNALYLPVPEDFPMTRQLHELRLESMELQPNVTPIDCPNLHKLTLLRIKCSSTVQLNAPKLDALIVEEDAFKFLRLQHFHVVRRLAIRRGYSAQEIAFPKFPNLDHLYLRVLPETSKRKRPLFGLPSTSVTKLTILKSSIEDALENFLGEFPNVDYLHLHSGYNLPSKIEAANLKKLLITNCETRHSILKASTQLEWLRLYNVHRDPYDVRRFDPLGDPRNCFELAPSKRFLPLVVNVPESIVEGPIRYSTLGFHFVENDEMLTW